MKSITLISDLRSIKEHPLNGSPVYPIIQLHNATWFATEHSALKPQEPGQGSIHFSFWHARLPEHSALIEHSGLQFGAIPIKFGKQEHAGASPTTLHWEYGPHGDGMHGFPLGPESIGSKEESI